MSAGLVVDLGNTTQQAPSLPLSFAAAPAGQTGEPSGALCGLSGVQVGAIVDMLHADTFTNLYICGRDYLISGQLFVGVQTSDSTASGTFTDPTSGLAQLPTVFQSGGIVWLNSGGGAGASGGLFGPFTSGQAIASGFHVTAGFQRPGRYVRAIFVSGAGGSGNQFVGRIEVGFVGQFRTTGSGGGFTFSPQTGGDVINV